MFFFLDKFIIINKIILGTEMAPKKKKQTKSVYRKKERQRKGDKKELKPTLSCYLKRKRNGKRSMKAEYRKDK